MGRRRMRGDVRRVTASHLLLYVILAIYVIVTITGILFLKQCIETDRYDFATNTFVALCSFCGSCSVTSVGFYCNKAKKENELQIANAKYKARFELAQKIFSANGNSLDKESISLLQQLMSDEGVAVSHADTDDFTPSSAVSMDWGKTIISNTSGKRNIFGDIDITSDDALGKG